MTDESIFTTALDISDVLRRAAYLEAACADDPARRARVEQLLAAYGKAGDFLERPAAAPDPAQADTRTLGTGDADSVVDACAFLQPSPRAGALGRIGHYDVLEVLGRGGFGVVFRAFDDTLQRVVAVKVLSPQMAATSPAQKRFLREARSSAGVRHENVVQVYDVGEQPLPFLVMEFIPGETLQQRLDRTGPLAVAEVVRIGRQIAEGLAAAHETGLIHRDVKPANVLIEAGPHERAKLTDFGLARAADDASISQSGVVAGTPMYMSPEQARGEALDHRSDLFSLGSVLYTMLSGRPPFRASGTLAVLKRVCEEQPRPIREVIPEVPEWLCRIVEKLHAKGPAERFQTAREVADLLADCEKQLQAHGSLKDATRIPAEKPTQRHTGSRWKRAAVVVGLVGAVGLAAVAALAGWGRWLAPDRQPEDDRAQVAINWDEPDLVVMVHGAGGLEYVSEGKTKGTGMMLAPGTYTLRAQRGGEVVYEHRFTVGPRDHRGFDVPRTSPAARPGDGWVQLFNGKDLTGWKAHPDDSGTWAVEDGAIVGPAGASYLFSERGDIENFHLRAEARINATGDAGIVFRTEFAVRRKSDKWVAYTSGYEAQIAVRANWPIHTGSLTCASDVSPPDGVLQKGPANPHRPDEWFRLEIIARGPHIQVFVDGRPAADYRDDASRFRRGHIALQTWGTNITTVRFRKIEIKELPPSPPVPPPLARVPFDPEKAKQHQEAWAKHLGVPVEFTNSLGMTFRLIPPGEFQMGIDPKDVDTGKWNVPAGWPENFLGKLWPDAVAASGPRHPVKLTRAFYIQTHEVRHGWYRKVMGEIPEIPASTDPDSPVRAFVSWPDAIAFCNALSRHEGKRPCYAVGGAGTTPTPDGDGYRLPTEAEWEWACRAGTATSWFFGDNPTAPNDRVFDQYISLNTKAPKPNPFGLFDMYASSSEWVWDGYEPYKPGPAVDPVVAPGGNRRVIRGGSNFDQSGRAFWSVNSFYRFGANPDRRAGYVGFGRVAISVPLPGATPLVPVAPGPSPAKLPAVVAFPFGPQKAAEYQEAWAKHLGLKEVEFTDKKVGMEFRVIPPGDFQMGAKEEEVNPEIKRFGEEKPFGWRLSVRSMESEKPRHPVRITRPFAIGKYEVTVGQFRKFVEDAKYKTVAEQKGGYGIENGRVVKGEKYNWSNAGYEQSDRSPVWNVTRDDAAEFCKWLSEKDGRTFRLPTEAEWEWACRAGTDTRTFWGTDKAADAHQYAQGSANNKHQPQPVGGLRPNPFGLYDTCGNVWEWCDDWYGEFYYKGSPGADPHGPAAAPGAGFTRHRVQRGGGVDGTHYALTSTIRKIDERPVCGFRVVCEIAGDAKLPPPEPKKSPEQANPAVAERRKEVEARSRARDEVALRLDAGTASKLDLLGAEVELSEARIKLAEAEKNPEGAADLLEELVGFRQEERDLIAMRVEVGADPRSALDKADARLADAKARLVELRPPERAPEPRPKP